MTKDVQPLGRGQGCGRGSRQKAIGLVIFRELGIVVLSFVYSLYIRYR